MRARDILKAVAAEHKLQVSDILGRDRFGHFVAARRQAILEMKAAGLTTFQISAIMKLSYDTIWYHLKPHNRAHRRTYNARRWREKQAGARA